MTTINLAWDQLVTHCDGRYLTNAELKPLHQYVQTLNVRTKTYEILRAKSAGLIKQSLKKFMLSHPDIMQKHSKRCVYDMSMTMCLMSVALLRDDPMFFKESLMLWLGNILAAHEKNTQCLQAYTYLQETINEQLPSVCNQLLKPYMDIVLDILDTPPKLMATVQRSGI